MTDLWLLIVYGVVLVCAVWLFAHRTDYKRWFYLAHAFSFASLMVGIWPGLEGSTIIGFISLLMATGLQTLVNVLFESQEKRVTDLPNSKLIKQ